MSKAKARVFVPLTKVDEEQRLVYGRITQDILDKSGEAMDYDTSKSHFEKWSNDIHTASNGLSKGNVRVMHGLTAAGKLTELDFNDVEKAIDVCAKVVDDKEWEKVQEGVYTGFSVGGNYEKRWTETLADGSKLKKFTAKPNEVSLVDNPCVPSALFTMTKADGTEVQVPFQVENDDEQWPAFSKAELDAAETAAAAVVREEPKPEGEGVTKADLIPTVAPGTYVPTNPEVAKRAEELCKVAAEEGKDWMDYLVPAREELIKAHSGAPREEPAAEVVEKAATEPKTGTKPAAAAKADDKPDVKAKKKDDKPVDKVTPPGVMQKWTTSDGKLFEKKADADAHQLTIAPLTDAEELAARLAKAVEGTEEPVEAEVTIVEVDDDMDRLAKALEAIEAGVDDQGKPKMQKGMYTVSKFARMIADMASLTSSVKMDEGDAATISPAMKKSIEDWAGSFKDYADSQITNILAGIDTDSLAPCYDYYYACAKADGTDQLAKDVCSIIDSRKADVDEAKDTLAKAFTVENVDPSGAEALEKFNKLSGQFEALKAVATDAIGQVESLTKRLKTVEDTPMPRAPNGKILGKSADNAFLGKEANTEEERMAILADMVKTHGADGLATMLIKAAHATGGQVIGLRPA